MVLGECFVYHCNCSFRINKIKIFSKMAFCYKFKKLINCSCCKFIKSHIKSSFGDISLIKKNNLKCSGGSNNLVPSEYFNNYQKGLFTSKKGKLNKITTWNVQELWWYCYKGNKINNIIRYLENCDSDVICLQEVFEEKSLWRIINSSKIIERYPYYLSGDMRKRFLIGENSGLLVLSKYPILFKQFTPFMKSKCPDFYAAKGALYFTVCDVNFITTHLQSCCANLAYKQLDFIINESPFDASEKTILLGDLNVDNPFKPLGVDRNNVVHTHDSGQILDHIIALPSGGQKNTGDINVEVSVHNIDLTNISDHYPVHGKIV